MKSIFSFKINQATSRSTEPGVHFSSEEGFFIGLTP